VSGLGVMLRKEVLEQVRTMRLLAVGGLFLVAGLLSPVLAKYLPEIIGQVAPEGMTIQLPTPTIADAIDQLMKNLSQFGTLAAILIAMGSVATEKERGTAAMVLTKPISRTSFLLAKLVALGLTLAVATAAGGTAAFAYTAWLFGAAPDALGFIAMCVLLWLSLLVYTALTFLGSTLARSVLPAAALGIIFLGVLGALSLLPTIGKLTPGALTGIAQQVGTGVPANDLLVSTVSNVLIVIVAFGVAWLSFRRQEL